MKQIILIVIIMIVSVFEAMAQSVCMLESNALLYNCPRVQINTRQLDRACVRRHGEGLQAFLITDTCNEHLAASLRGDPAPVAPATPAANAPTMVEAACLTYEQGQTHNCSVYEYSLAYNFCVNNFGHRYIPHVISNRCSLENASIWRGEIAASELVTGLASALDEIEGIMNMVDRSPFNSTLASLFKLRPNVESEFYTDTIRILMAKMNMAKNTMLNNSNKNIRFTDNPHARAFVEYAFRYMNVLGRLYKVYAYVAHQNHLMLETYKFENLSYLSLKLKKEYALELIARVQYRFSHVDNGKNILVEVSEQEKQTFEFEAISEPRTQVDYAKLISFASIRDTLTNRYTAQKLTNRTIEEDAVMRCGRGFLSFRPGYDGLMSRSDAYQELYRSDLFYNGYIGKWRALADATNHISLLDLTKAQDLYLSIIWGIPEVRRYLRNNPNAPMSTRDMFVAMAQQDAPALVEAENIAWISFANDHFASIVLPGDNFVNPEGVIARIGEEMFEKRVVAITDVILGSHPWFSDATLELIKNRIREKIEREYKENWINRLSETLTPVLGNYNSQRLLSYNAREKMIKQAILAASDSALAALYLKELSTETPHVAGVKRLQPQDLEELTTFANTKIDKEFYDVRFTMQVSPEKAAIFQNFLQNVGRKFREKNHDEIEAMSALQEENLDGRLNYLTRFMQNNVHGRYTWVKLRRAAIEAARELYRQHPFEVGNRRVRTTQGIFLERPEYQVYSEEDFIPIDSAGNPVGVSSRDMDRMFMQSLRPGGNTVDRNNLSARIWRMFGIRNVAQSLFGSNDRHNPESDMIRNNQDAITSGEIGAPTEVFDTGVIRSTRQDLHVEVERMRSILATAMQGSRLAAISSRLRNNQPANEPSSVSFYRHRTQGTRLRELDTASFVFRFLDALNLSFVANDSRSEETFAPMLEDQKILANIIAGKTYQAAPILRHIARWEREVPNDTGAWRAVGLVDSTRTVEETGPILEKIARKSMNTRTGYINIDETRDIIMRALGVVVQHTQGKLEDFCESNYFNFENDETFKNMFESANKLRNILMSPAAGDTQKAEFMRTIDEGIKRRLRTENERITEDYLDPLLLGLGAMVLVAGIVAMVIGTGGAAAPGIMGGLYAVCTTVVAVEFYVSFPISVAATYFRLNHSFIEVPEQLKFHESLSHTQLASNQLVDFDQLDSLRQESDSQKMWNLGFSAFDVIYAGTLARHMYTSTGFAGRAAYRRVTGHELRAFSAPPPSMLNRPTFAAMRERRGLMRAAWLRARQVGAGVLAYLPRFQPISQSMIQTGVLRQGIVRKFAELGIADNPWALLVEIQNYTNNFRARLSTYSTFVVDENRILEYVRLNGRVRLSDLRTFGPRFATFTFIPEVVRLGYRSGNILNVLLQAGEVWKGIRTIQGHIIQERIKHIESIVQKLHAVHEAERMAPGSNQDLAEEFIALLSDEEILVLEELAKQSNGRLREFRTIFSDHRIVVEGLRPMAHLYGQTGVAFRPVVYPQNTFIGETVGSNYVVPTVRDDLQNYYESMMAQNGLLSDEALRTQRQAIEEALSQMR